MKTQIAKALLAPLASKLLPVLAVAMLIVQMNPGPVYSQEQARPAVTENAVALAPEQAEWMPCPEGSPKGCEMAVLYGGLASENPHILYRAPAGSAPFPTFWHSGSEHGVMIQGELIGTGEDGNEYRIGPGTYWYLPAGMIHGGVRCSEEEPCMWYESFDKPWDSNMVKPATKRAEKAPSPTVEWDLPAPVAELSDDWGDVPSVPNYARTYLYIPEMLAYTDPFLIAVSNAEHLEPSMVWMIKVVVSATNECQYCLSQAVTMAQHSGFSEEQVYAVQTDIGVADLSNKRAALLRLALAITKSPGRVGPYVDAAREAGWDDPQIAQAIHVAAAWNYTNRFALAFGLKPDWLHPYDVDAAVPIRTAGTRAERQFLINFLTGGPVREGTGAPARGDGGGEQ